MSFCACITYMHAGTPIIIDPNDGDIDFNDENIFNVSVDSGDQEVTTEHGKIASYYLAMYIYNHFRDRTCNE